MTTPPMSAGWADGSSGWGRKTAKARSPGTSGTELATGPCTATDDLGGVRPVGHVGRGGISPSWKVASRTPVPLTMVRTSPVSSAVSMSATAAATSAGSSICAPRVRDLLAHEVVDECGLHTTGADGVDADTDVEQLRCGAAHERHHRVLRGAVERVVVVRAEPGERRSRDDRGAVAVSAEQPGDGEGGEQHPVDVHAHDAAVLREAHVEDRVRVLGGGDPGVEVGEVE